MSIRLRLTLWYSGLLICVLIAFGLSVYTVVYNNTMGDIRKQLIEVAEGTDVYSTRLNLGASIPQGLANTIYVQLVDYSRSPTVNVSKSQNMRPSDINPHELTFPYPKYSDAVGHHFKKVTVNDSHFLLYELSVSDMSGTLVGYLQVGAYTEREESMFSQMRTILWTSGVVGAIAAFCLGLFLARKALRPIEKVTEAAERVQSGSDLKLRIPGESQDEIGRLTRTLNHMLERVEKAYNVLEESNTAQRRFVSDASHELRTPLTTIRGNVDLLEKVWSQPSEGGTADGDYGTTVTKPRLSLAEREELSREALHDISDEARRMSRLVNDLLSLARADSGYVVDKEPIELMPLVEEAARRASFLPRTSDWKVGPLDALAGVSVVGNRDYLMQLLFILIENGFKYTPAGEVRLETYRGEDRVGISIVDTGIGISKSDMPRIFDRFYRADESRGQTTGTGLGLSIAKWIADMHRAVLDVQSAPEGGSRFTIWLPVDFSERADYGIMEASVRPAVPDREPS